MVYSINIKTIIKSQNLKSLILKKAYTSKGNCTDNKNLFSNL